MSDILFVKTSSLGDVIHHMPALTEASARRPDARFAWVVEQAFAPLVALHPAVCRVIPVNSRGWRRAFHRGTTWRAVETFLADIRARPFDEIIDTQGLVRSALIAKAAIGRRHGYDRASIRESLASIFYDVRHQVGRRRHAIGRNRALTGLALGYAPEGAPDYGLDRAALAEQGDSAYAIFLHGTTRDDKSWPADRWVALGKELWAAEVRLLLPWGTDGERLRSLEIAQHLPGAEVPDRQPLDAVARLVAGAQFVVGVDTGLTHLAAALGVPLVAIFAASEPGLTGPMGPGPIAIVGTNGTPPAVAAVIAAARGIGIAA